MVLHLGGEIWLELSICPDCGGSGVWEAVNECDRCKGTGEAWVRVADDDDQDQDDWEDEE